MKFIRDLAASNGETIMNEKYFFETNQDEITRKIIEPFMGNAELLIKMYEAIKEFDKEYAKTLQEQSIDSNNIYDMLNDLIFQYVYHYVYTEPIINDISLHDLESDNEVIYKLAPDKGIDII